MGRPREHDEATREALLAAAERLVAAGGPEALSVRAVADEVGTTTRAVYSLFGSKAGLHEALAARLFELLGRAIDGLEPTADPLHDVVVASIEGFRGVALAHPSLYRLVFLRMGPNPDLGPRFDAVAAATFGRLEALLARAAAAGRLGATPPGEAARLVHALTEGLATVELRGGLGPPAEAEAVWARAVAALLSGLATAPALEPPEPSAP